MSDSHQRFTAGLALLTALCASGAYLHAVGVPPPSQSGVTAMTITASGHAFRPSRIEVNQGDIVKITFVADDTAHSFTIDEYRIAKRALPGRSVTFEFCADRAGRFVFYCSLTADERCREMRGELIVR